MSKLNLFKFSAPEIKKLYFVRHWVVKDVFRLHISMNHSVMMHEEKNIPKLLCYFIKIPSYTKQKNVPTKSKIIS